MSLLGMIMFFRHTRPVVHMSNPNDVSQLRQWEHMVDTYVDESKLPASEREDFKLLCEVGLEVTEEEETQSGGQHGS